MKLAISNIAWDLGEERTVGSRLRGWGIAGVEVAPSRVWPDLAAVSDSEVASYRAFWLDHDMVIPSMQALLYGRPDLTIFHDASTRARTLAYLHHAVRIGALLGAKVLVFGSPRNRQRGDMRDDVASAIAVDFFTTLGDQAVDAGVAIALEANPLEYGCDFLMTNVEVAAFVRTLDHPGIVHHVDLGGTILAGELPGEIVRDAWPVAHVHASEPHLASFGTHDHEHAHRALAGALTTAGYSRWVSIEMRRDPSDPVGAVERAAGFAATVYRCT